MAGFLYYLPGATEHVNLKTLQDAGLGYAFDTPSPTCVGVMANGFDDGHSGTIAADPKRVEKIGVYRKEQTATKSPKSGVYLVRYTGVPVGPTDLARKEQLGGHWVTLNDGNEWLCPVARGAVEENGGIYWTCNLPQMLEMNDEGDFGRGDVVARFASFWELASEWHDIQHSAREDSDGETLTLTVANLAQKAIAVLAVNYLIGPTEVQMLRLISEDQAVEILNATIDMPTQDELLKKIIAQSDGSLTEDGPSDVTPVTDQP